MIEAEGERIFRKSGDGSRKVGNSDESVGRIFPDSFLKMDGVGGSMVEETRGLSPAFPPSFSPSFSGMKMPTNVLRGLKTSPIII